MATSCGSATVPEPWLDTVRRLSTAVVAAADLCLPRRGHGAERHRSPGLLHRDAFNEREGSNGRNAREKEGRRANYAT